MAGINDIDTNTKLWEIQLES